MISQDERLSRLTSGASVVPVGGCQGAGQSPGIGPESANVRWRYAPGDGYGVSRSAPVVGADGTVYLARECQGTFPPCGSAVDAIGPDGNRRWEWADGGEAIFRSTPAVAPDGTVYVTSDEGPGNLIAIGPGGVTKWKVTGDNLQGPPSLGADGTVYVQSASSDVYAVRAFDGAVLWHFAAAIGSVGLRATPALSADGSTLYVGSSGGVLYALTTDGKLRWQTPISGPTGGHIENAPAVGPDGTIYVATGGSSGNAPGDIDAFSPSGVLKWHYTADGTFETTPAVGSNGLVVAGDDVGAVVALNVADGTLAWSFHAPGTYGSNGFYASSGALGSDGTVYIQNGEGIVFALRDGSSLWTATGASDASPALPANGVLYVAGASGALTAYSR